MYKFKYYSIYYFKLIKKNGMMKKKIMLRLHF